MWRTAGAVRRAEPFRNDPLATELARLAKDNRAILGEMLVENDAELVRLSRTSIADEMREEHRRRVLGE
jgi:hypothetical protein